jgi:hypothetical protein
MTSRVRIPPVKIASAAASAAALAAALTTGASAASGPAQASPATGPGWRVVKVIGTKNVVLRATAARSAGNAWIGGLRATTFETPVLYHLAGGRAQMTVPAGGNGVGVNSVSASSASNVWACDLGAPFVLRLTKTGWSAHSVAIGKDEVSIAGVVATGRSSVWALAEDISTRRSYAYHYNGKTWQRTPIPHAPDADSQVGIVSGTSDANIWALTFTGKAQTPAAFYYNGRKWALTRFPASVAKDQPLEILAESRSDAWATLGSATSTTPTLILLHWNGARWSRVTGKLPHDSLLGALSSDGHGGLWLPGADGVHEVMLHSSGGHWSSARVPTTGGKLPDVAALTLVPGTRTVLATGPIAYGPGGDDGSTVLEYSP